MSCKELDGRVSRKVPGKTESRLFVRLITLHSGNEARSDACCEAMLPLRDMQGPSDWEPLPGDGARPCFTAGRPRDEAFGVCSPAAAGTGKGSARGPDPRESPQHPNTDSRLTQAYARCAMRRPLWAPIPVLQGIMPSLFSCQRMAQAEQEST